MHFFERKNLDNRKPGEPDIYREVTAEEANCWCDYFTEPLNPDDTIKSYWYYRDSLEEEKEFRTDPIFIKVVEELGEEASSEVSRLEIVEIPDNVEWEIDDYDGIEWVSEKHRTWRRYEL